jgi:hypothetical protein
MIGLWLTAAQADYILYGQGSLSCQEWLNRRKSETWYEMGEWMLGFISAVAYYDIQALKEKNPQDFLPWMDAYCRENPQHELADGVQKLVEALKP